MSKIDYQALRDAAEKATQGEWVAFISPGKYGTYAAHTPGDNHHGDIVDWPGFDEQKNAENNARYIAAFNPEVVQALLDELESKQTFQQAFFRQSLMYDVVAEAYEEAKEQIAKDVEIKTRLCLESNSLFDRLRAAEKHIAELEARTVTLPDRKSEIFWPGDAYEFDSLGYVIAVKSTIHAAGIQIIEEGKTDGQ